MSNTASRQCLRVLMAVSLLCGPALGWAAGAKADPDDAIGRYVSRREHAATIEQALKQRVAQLERQSNDVATRSARLQQQLGILLTALQAADDRIWRLQADINANRSSIDASQRRVDELNKERRRVEQQIEERKARAWLCYVPIANIYCMAEKLADRRDALDGQLRDIGNRLRAAERQRNEARAKLAGLEAERRAAGDRRIEKQREVRDSEQNLIALHAALAASRSARQRHQEALDSFSRELQQIEQLPPSQRQAAAERRLARLDLQLAKEMVQACRLIATDSPRPPSPLRQACALA